MAEIITYILSNEKLPFILNGDLSNNFIGKVELVKHNLCKVEITGRINLHLKLSGVGATGP